MALPEAPAGEQEDEGEHEGARGGAFFRCGAAGFPEEGEEDGYQRRQPAEYFDGLANHGVFGHDFAGQTNDGSVAGAVRAQRENYQQGEGGEQEGNGEGGRVLGGRGGAGGFAARDGGEPEQDGDEQEQKEGDADIDVAGHAGAGGGDESDGFRGIGGEFGEAASAGHDGVAQMAAHDDADDDGEGCEGYQREQGRP